jgi:hypothetical protein
MLSYRIIFSRHCFLSVTLNFYSDCLFSTQFTAFRFHQLCYSVDDFANPDAKNVDSVKKKYFGRLQSFTFAT